MAGGVAGGTSSHRRLHTRSEFPKARKRLPQTAPSHRRLQTKSEILKDGKRPSQNAPGHHLVRSHRPLRRRLITAASRAGRCFLGWAKPPP